jgi:hypothetical protein
MTLTAGATSHLMGHGIATLAWLLITTLPIALAG